MKTRSLLFAGVLAAAAAPAHSHHSYAMFDFAKHSEVEGVIAKLEWTNPHTYLWVYVPSKTAAGKYDLYSFENGPITLMTRLGWSKTTFVAGQKVKVEFAPLRDGRTGGHFLRATHANGRIIAGDDGLPTGEQK